MSQHIKCCNKILPIPSRFRCQQWSASAFMKAVISATLINICARPAAGVLVGTFRTLKGTLEQGSKPTNFHIEPSDELATQPGVDPSYAHCVTPRDPERDKVVKKMRQASEFITDWKVKQRFQLNRELDSLSTKATARASTLLKRRMKDVQKKVRTMSKIHWHEWTQLMLSTDVC